MQTDLTSCNQSALRRFINGDSAMDEQLWVEKHLDGCSQCKFALEGLAADLDFWVETAQALNTLPEFKRLKTQATSLSLDSLSRITYQDDSGETSLPADLELDDQHGMLQRWLSPSSLDGSIGCIGKYEVLSVIGRGGMGLVLKAMDTELHRTVAIKTLVHHISSQSEGRLRLAREARVAAALRHPHVVPIFGMETWRDVPLIVMPMIDGGTLQQYADNHSINVVQVIKIGLQIASALSSLHAEGIVHRDLKPSNILLQEGIEHVMLSDFGLARFDGDAAITHSDAIVGTPFFMSPEQATGGEIGAASDLFSLGSVLFWLCSGRYPFHGTTNYATLARLVHHDPDFFMLRACGIPDYLQRLIRGLLAKKPNERWASADEVGRLLQSCLDHFQSPSHPIPIELLSIQAAKPLMVGEKQNNKRRIAWSVAIATLLLVCATWSIWGRSYSSLASQNSPTANKDPFPNNHVGVPAPHGNTMAAEGDGTTADSAATISRKTSDIAEDSTDAQHRHGPLDELDLMIMSGDLAKGLNLVYWLRRLANLQVDEIPVEILPRIRSLMEDSDAKVRELAQVVFNKNPFQEVLPKSARASSSDQENLSYPDSNSESPTENPFEEVMDDE